MSNLASPLVALPARWPLAATLLALLQLALAVLAVAQGGPGYAFMAAALTALGMSVLLLARARRQPTLADILPHALVVGLFGLCTDMGFRVWQVPGSWADVPVLSQPGAIFATGFYLVGAAWPIIGRGRQAGPMTLLALALTPFVFNALFVLAAPHLVRGLAAWTGVPAGSMAELVLGRTILLLAFNQLAVTGIGWLMDRHVTRRLPLHALLLLSAFYASCTPHLASLGTHEAVAGLPAILRLALVPLAAAVALAGLWAQVFLVTGVLLDAMHQRRPTFYAAKEHWRGGLTKGAIYSLVFMLLIQAAGIVLGSETGRWIIQTFTLPVALIAGALLYPLAKTIIESFDGSAPFFWRLRANSFEGRSYLRGLVVGAGLALAAAMALPEATTGIRFLVGFAIGAMAYAGIDLLCDAWHVRRGPRLRLQGWRVYALGAVLGGIVGGALTWYCDAYQLAAVTNKFWAYATVSNPLGGRLVEDYVIYPLFSKWGAISLGGVDGGVRLLYNESLSGVINWSLAAPLFSINLVFLTALLQGSLAPIRALLSVQGLAGLVEQAIRVLRWGLWMAPVIYSFLRLAPDPTWYNQDGAVRTAVATVQSWTLSPEAFRAWSLQLFLGLLAYDWLRVLIWFDHMGLRVATLVNLSFVGGDMADERAARFLGHSGRSRVVPDGIRRFATWAPLLIPFYIPRNAEWDQIWGEAERIAATAPPLLPSVSTLLTGYAVMACVAVVVALVIRWRARPGPKVAAMATAETLPWSPASTFHLSNGIYILDAAADGRSWNHAIRPWRQGPEIDLVRRSTDRLELTGKFFYLRDLAPGNAHGLWSVGWQPCRAPLSDYAVIRTGTRSLKIVGTHAGIRAEAEVRLVDEELAEVWDLRLTNLTDTPRTLELTSYQELAVATWDGYRRTPSYNAVHVGTWFVRGMGMLLARNRLLRPTHERADPAHLAAEVAFHAVGGESGPGWRLVGYEDSRCRFVGAGSAEAPAGLVQGLRQTDDEGQLYTFDPAASLQLRVELAANGTASLRFVDGYARTQRAAARLVARLTGKPAMRPETLGAVLSRHRQLVPAPVDPAGAYPHRFAPDGTELEVGYPTARPWSHVMANELGHGAIVSNDGAMSSFAGNAQQNVLTSFDLDTVAAPAPGQGIYVLDLESGEVSSPAFLPCRRSDARHEVLFGRGYASFRMRAAELELELDMAVLPDRPVEVRRLCVRNLSAVERSYRIVFYSEMVLADLVLDSQWRLQTQSAPELPALFFSNPRNDFRRGWAFAATSMDGAAWETMRAHFLGGPDHDLRRPHFVLAGTGDRNQTDDGRRVAAFAATVKVPAGGEHVAALALGMAGSLEEARALAAASRSVAAAEAGLLATRDWWAERLGRLRVETTLPAFDRLVNDWLPYQVLTARLWGRLGPNQRGGAFGFRDQLQDVLPFMLLEPALARRQILLHAGQQFLEGDVLQWWHRSWEGRTGLGSRNHASDAHLWLPYVTAHYLAATGDMGILDERVPFLEGRPIPHGAEGITFAPRASRDEASLYEHCKRAIERTLARLGPNGLPLIGSGDWNDGYSDVGIKGRGESVWLGFFLHGVLLQFADIAERVEGNGAAGRFLAAAETLQANLERMWRGDRYVRLTTDDGHEIKSFDALMAAWPILSDAVDQERGQLGMTAALAELEKEHLVLLLTPPFTETSAIVPGRIAKYPPGVRENAAQYSHGSSWVVDACIRLAAGAAARGDAAAAEAWRKRAAELWLKISPISNSTPEQLVVYGLPPHQQPADIYWGPGYEGRGGWAWYTGSAARMLWAAYQLLGLRAVDGGLELEPDAFAAKGPIRLQRVTFEGRVLEAGARQGGPESSAREATPARLA